MAYNDSNVHNYIKTVLFERLGSNVIWSDLLIIRKLYFNINEPILNPSFALKSLNIHGLLQVTVNFNFADADIK